METLTNTKQIYLSQMETLTNTKHISSSDGNSYHHQPQISKSDGGNITSTRINQTPNTLLSDANAIFARKKNSFSIV